MEDVYKISITYKDNNKLDVNIQKQDILPFMDRLKKGEIFWAHDSSFGFFTDYKEIRYLEITRVEEWPKEDTTTKQVLEAVMD